MKRLCIVMVIISGCLCAWPSLPFAYQSGPFPDFDNDGVVGFADFLQFAGRFGSERGDETYEAKYDLNSDGSIGFPDFLIFAASFGKAAPSSPIEAFCEDWEELRNSKFIYSNNVWGKGEITDYEQCLLKRAVGGNTQFGWRWRWLAGSGGVKAYPEVIYGHKPWYTYSTTTDLASRISSISQLQVNYDVEMTAQGKYNLAFEMWVTSDNPPTPATITHEIMIWVDRTFEPQSSEYQVAQVEIDGFTYDLYVNPGFGNHTYIAFASHADQFSGTLNVEKFLGYLIEHDHLTADHYVTSVELGNEVIEGTGKVWLRRFHINATTSDSNRLNPATREALAVLYTATNGDNWTNKANWLTDRDIATWHGVGVSNGRVLRLDLVDNNLTGQIPVELGNLTGLIELSLDHNQLSGFIPPELGHLDNLRELHLVRNKLTGPIPEELGGLDSLRVLALGGNQLRGEIPVELGNLTNLTSLSLGWNRLSGGIPVELGNLTNLVELWLDGNALTGSIPVAMGNLVNLKVLELEYNQLSGMIPAALGNLVNLERFELRGNPSLTGALPQSLTRLTKLEHFLFERTGLCAPLDSDFQWWLHGIRETSGSNCSQ